jgi:CheY-like chemotaxis protein
MYCAKVLIVDDEPISRQTIAEGLRGKNFDVFEAESGHRQWKRFKGKNGYRHLRHGHAGDGRARAPKKGNEIEC